MKKHVVLLGVIVSALACAAAEPSTSAKKMNCVDLARHMMREGKAFPYVAFQFKSEADRPVRIGQNRVGDWGCDELVEEKWQRVSRKASEHTNEQLLSLERCVQESPEYEQEPEVRAQVDFLKKQADLWPQCLQAQREEAARQRAQKEKEQEVDAYIWQDSRSFFDRWFPRAINK